MLQEQRLSLCFCTYQRADQLRIALDHVLKCKDELRDGDEIIVIDNNSSDDTHAVVQAFTKRLPIKYYFESTQGLSSARNRAVSEFINDVIIFFDDDVSVLSGCITAYRSSIKKYPHHGFFGGKIHVDWLNGKPRWLKSDNLSLLNGLFIHYDLGETDLSYALDQPENRHTPYGANFALRRDLIEKTGLFDISLGVNGEEISRGEEADYFHRALVLMEQGMYIADAKVEHRFALDRLELTYLFRYGVAKGRAEVQLHDASSDSWLTSSLAFLLKGIYQLIKLRRDRFYQCIINMGIMRGVYAESQKRFK